MILATRIEISNDWIHIMRALMLSIVLFLCSCTEKPDPRIDYAINFDNKERTSGTIVQSITAGADKFSMLTMTASYVFEGNGDKITVKSGPENENVDTYSGKTILEVVEIIKQRNLEYNYQMIEILQSARDE